MNTRIRDLRIAEGLSQVDFGNKLGMTRHEIYNLESGRTRIKESDLKLIVSTFKVSEEWLRTGNGDMYVFSNNNLIAAEVLCAIDKNERLAKAMLKFSKLNDKELEAMEKLLDIFQKD
ncbi:TPA: helix-turn-helix transcriptional regulator [Clostridioides difficile]|jgi:transcriptional regulator with XRE-family HTH domain|uniref:helix-turn-helix domain-containing protein n=1 Tax=Clostridioides difficile TaxID=1496 RepID=UPI0010274540|nr:helix-turn-helix transcriptional regulator [Clostridioides difficile]MCP8402581.1 helix-turn-helix domain-containing protein [Clostridioides difficile]MDO0037852.1 helix-turn-helix transcriptional regulator [Clostridioides difficile]MDX5681779.1 helix-turn-helix transcriptional regulator [Clostridioides difficile]VFD70378.1 transcriptional regulator [Clostridioides difficile]HBF0668846.1 helix-turn-helix transcriptional regulator [Clostridioides difficile]